MQATRLLIQLLKTAAELPAAPAPVKTPAPAPAPAIVPSPSGKLPPLQPGTTAIAKPLATATAAPYQDPVGATYETNSQSYRMWKRPIVSSAEVAWDRRAPIEPAAAQAMSAEDLAALKQLPNVKRVDMGGTGFNGSFTPSDGTLQTSDHRMVALHEATHAADPEANDYLKGGPRTPREQEVPAMVTENVEAMRQGVPASALEGDQPWLIAHTQQHGPKLTGQPADFQEVERWTKQLRAGDNELARRYRDWFTASGGSLPPAPGGHQHGPGCGH